MDSDAAEFVNKVKDQVRNRQKKNVERCRVRVAGIRSEKSYRDYDANNGESTEFEWNIFPGFTTLHLCGKFSDLLSYLGQTPAT